MLHMQFLSMAIKLVDAARDGQVTVDEVIDCLGETFPGLENVTEAIDEAMEDGKISVMEVFNIVTSAVS